MAKTNTFYGATMAYAAVAPYLTNVLFHHFAFQQVMRDAPNGDDNFSLIAYAVDTSFNPMNNGNTIQVMPLIANGLTAPSTVAFANLRLNITALKGLYPNGSQSDLTVTPTGFYNRNGVPTYYVEYTASTVNPNPDKEHPELFLTAKVDPSPPA